MKCSEWKTTEEIQDAVVEVAQAINIAYEGKEIILIGVLNGAVVFMADLMRHIHLDVKIDFVGCSSYGKDKKAGNVFFTKLWDLNLNNQHIIIVDDIYDTGGTMLKIIEKINENSIPASIATCTLIRRDDPTIMPPDFFVFNAGRNDWVYGYGLDNALYNRNIPSIYRIDKD